VGEDPREDVCVGVGAVEFQLYGTFCNERRQSLLWLRAHICMVPPIHQPPRCRHVSVIRYIHQRVTSPVETFCPQSVHLVIFIFYRATHMQRICIVQCIIRCGYVSRRSASFDLQAHSRSLSFVPFGRPYDFLLVIRCTVSDILLLIYQNLKRSPHSDDANLRDSLSCRG